jgi:hypothetical protein
VSGAYYLATYQPIPDSSPFTTVVPYREVFGAFLLVGIILLVLVVRNASGQIKMLVELRRLSEKGDEK